MFMERINPRTHVYTCMYTDTCIFLHNIQSHEKPLICTPVHTHTLWLGNRLEL